MSRGRKILLVCGIAFAAFFVFRIVQFAIYLKKHPYEARVIPGESAFRAANHQIISSHGTVVFGNSAEAIKLAAEYSTQMKALRETFFSKGKPNDDLFQVLAKGDFLTYCHLDTNACVFLLHVPELRRFTKDAKDSLSELAWLNAQSILKANLTQPPKEVVIGLKGELWYDPILIGVYRDDPKDGKDGVKTTESGIEAMRVFYPYFKSEEASPITSKNQP